MCPSNDYHGDGRTRGGAGRSFAVERPNWTMVLGRLSLCPPYWQSERETLEATPPGFLSLVERDVATL